MPGLLTQGYVFWKQPPDAPNQTSSTYLPPPPNKIFFPPFFPLILMRFYCSTTMQQNRYTSGDRCCNLHSPACSNCATEMSKKRITERERKTNMVLLFKKCSFDHISMSESPSNRWENNSWHSHGVHLRSLVRLWWIIVYASLVVLK